MLKANLLGIDVYHGDGNINWSQVSSHSPSISFAYLKSSESTTSVDPLFKINRSAAAAVGITTGAYHFYHADVDPIKQAEFFCNQIGSVASYEIAPCCDFEISALPSGKTKHQSQADLLLFLQTIETTLGVKPIIYTNYNSWVYILGEPNFASSGYRLWIADYSSSPRLFGGWTEWSIWQYTGSGTVSGVPNAGGTDVNYYNWSSAII